MQSFAVIKHIAGPAGKSDSVDDTNYVMQVRHVCHVELSQRESGVPDLDAQLDLLATVTQTMTMLQVS